MEVVAKRKGQLFNKDLWRFEFTYRSCDLRCGRLQFVVLRDTATSFIWTIRLRIDVVAEEGDQSVNTVTGTFGLTSRRRLLVLRLRLFGCWLRILRLFGGLWWTVYFHFAGLRGRLKVRQTNRHYIGFRNRRFWSRDKNGSYLLVFWFAGTGVGSVRRGLQHVT